MSAPDPRTVRSQDAILAAARALLMAEGPAAVTHQRVATRAGVGRATVYRHWPRPDQLLLAAMSGADLPYFNDPTVPVRRWLAGELNRLAGEMALPEVVAVSLTLMHGALWSPEAADRRDGSVGTITERLGAALALAVEAGELEAAPDPADAAAVLVGPIFYRTNVQAGAVRGDLVDRLLDAVGTWREPASR